MNILSETERAYIAGIIDGEGCFTIGRYRVNKKNIKLNKVLRQHYHHPLIVINMTDENLVRWIFHTTGCGNIRCRDTGKGKWGKNYYKKQYVWYLSKHNDILDFINQIYNFLKIKRIQSDIILKYCEKTYSTSSKCRRISNEQYLYRNSLYADIREANSGYLSRIRNNIPTIQSTN